MDNVWRNQTWKSENGGVLGMFIRRTKDLVDWEDEIVVVTGGASGIGLSIVETLAVRNVCVVALDIEPIQSQCM